MKKWMLLLALVGSAFSGMSQSTEEKKKSKAIVNLGNRSNDHFLIQYGYDGWQAPDSIRTTGFTRHFNMYAMMDFPFKTAPNWSVALGVGLGTSHIFLDEQKADIISTGGTLNFVDVSNQNHYKKYKIASAYAELPIELRWSSNPADNDKAFKVSAGIKVGTLLSVHTKGKTLQDKDDQDLNEYVEKLKDRRYFNSLRLAPTLRIGYGFFSVYGAYQINSFVKDGSGPQINPYSIGICISGL